MSTSLQQANQLKLCELLHQSPRPLRGQVIAGLCPGTGGHGSFRDAELFQRPGFRMGEAGCGCLLT